MHQRVIGGLGGENKARVTADHQKTFDSAIGAGEKAVALDEFDHAATLGTFLLNQ
jgi:hypothetical protein